MLLEKQASSPFVSLTVLTGKVTSLTPGSQGSAEVEVSVIKVYKAGRLKFRKRGPTTSAKLTATCMKCPALRKGERNTHTKLVQPQAVLQDSFSITVQHFRINYRFIFFIISLTFNCLIIIVNLLHRRELCADGQGE